MPPELDGPSGPVYVLEGSSSPKLFNYSERWGLPPPHAYLWSLNGRAFAGNPRVDLLNGNKTLSVREASRDDGGNYTITAQSLSGQASLTLDLRITCMFQLYGATGAL